MDETEDHSGLISEHVSAAAARGHADVLPVLPCQYEQPSQHVQLMCFHLPVCTLSYFWRSQRVKLLWKFQFGVSITVRRCD